MAEFGASRKKALKMKMKASVDYGVRTILYLAVKGGTCSSREISEEMNVPRDYLIQLALRLRNAGLIKARPGKNGGYVLARPASEIKICNILDAFDNDLKHVRQPMKTGRNASITAAEVRDIHDMVAESFERYLNSISVQDLVDVRESNGSPYDVIADALEGEIEILRRMKA